jgi:hypothetical protein
MRLAKKNSNSAVRLLMTVGALGLLVSCAENRPAAIGDQPIAQEDALHAQIQTIVVIYD